MRRTTHPAQDRHGWVGEGEQIMGTEDGVLSRGEKGKCMPMDLTP